MFRMIFICTGNQARSVIAERYVKRATAGLPVTVESGGTLDIPAGPALQEAVIAGRNLGLELGDHQSRCLIGIDFSDADLVIGFEQHHVASAVVDGGAAADKTFLMAELVRLLKSVTPPSTGDVEERARAAISSAHGVRVATNSFVPGEELTDPAGRDSRFFDETAAAIARMCDEFTRQLFPVDAQTEQEAESPRKGVQW